MWKPPPASGGGSVTLADVTLSSPQTTFDLNPPLNFGNVVTASLFAMVKSTTAAGFTLMALQFNGDSTVNDYAWSGANSDNSHAIATVGSSTFGSQTNAMLLGTIPAASAVASNEWGILNCKLYNPGAAAQVKNVHMECSMLSDFTSYFVVNPIEWRGGGFWIGPGAITRITLLLQAGQFAAGSRIVVSTP